MSECSEPVKTAATTMDELQQTQPIPVYSTIFAPDNIVSQWLIKELVVGGMIPVANRFFMHFSQKLASDSPTQSNLGRVHRSHTLYNEVPSVTMGCHKFIPKTTLSPLTTITPI